MRNRRPLEPYIRTMPRALWGVGIVSAVTSANQRIRRWRFPRFATQFTTQLKIYDTVYDTVNDIPRAVYHPVYDTFDDLRHIYHIIYDTRKCRKRALATRLALCDLDLR